MIKLTKTAEEMTLAEQAAYIDYSVLKPEFTPQEIIDLAKDGVRLEVATICFNPGYMSLVAPICQGTKTKLCPVVDFPFGLSSTASRIAQIQDVAKYDNIGEIDIVANYGKLRAGLYDEVTADLKAVADAAHATGNKIKVILETDALNEEQIRAGVECTIAAGADFVKTSTGFLTGFDLKGAAPEVIAVIQDQAGDRIKVKGSGNVRTREHFLKLINMGIDRIAIGYRSVPVVLDLKK